MNVSITAVKSENMERKKEEKLEVRIICGYKGAGKSTYAAMYAQKYDWDWLDTDLLMLEGFQKERNLHFQNSLSSCNHPEEVSSISALYRYLGESAFRSFEQKIIADLKYDNFQKNTIISLGGGVVLKTENVEYLKTLGCLVYLKVAPEVLYQRTKQCGLFHDYASFLKYYESRKDLYTAVADEILEWTLVTLV